MYSMGNHVPTEFEGLSGSVSLLSLHLPTYKQPLQLNLTK